MSMLADLFPMTIVEEGRSTRFSVPDDTFNAILGAVPLQGGYTMTKISPCYAEKPGSR